MHQDAHEFLMFIISTISEDIEADIKKNQKEIEDLPKSLPFNGSTGAITNGSHTNGTNRDSNGHAHANDSSSEVSLTLNGGDEVRIRINGADIKTASSSSNHGHSQGPGGGESIGDRSSIQSESTIPKPKEKMWVQKLFEGQLTNEIKCLTCEKVCPIPLSLINRGLWS
jgi:hypothetical protein